MHIEFGDFSTIGLDGYKRINAVVTIPASAWPSLEIGDYESTDRVTPCFAWCVARFGQGGDRWILRFEGEESVRILFRDAVDATAFHVTWARLEPGVAAALAA